jgi:hypothetical protein
MLTGIEALAMECGDLSPLLTSECSDDKEFGV